MAISRKNPSADVTQDVIPLIPAKDFSNPPQNGRATQKRRVSMADILTGLLCMCCLLVALISVEYAAAAISLGQANQLIILGFVLSLMSYCANHQLRLALLAAEVRYGKSSLQNLEALLARSAWKDHASFFTRAMLCFMFSLPVALGVLYKIFQGGETTSSAFPGEMRFGLTGPPGTQYIGVGVSLFINATLPWYKDPGFDRVYGFNMYVESANRTALVDGPLAESVSSLQASLGPYETRRFTADVHAVVCNLEKDTVGDSKRRELNDRFNMLVDNAEGGFKQWVYTDDYWLGLMYHDDGVGLSHLWMSWRNVSAGENFGSQARRYHVTWEKYRATWSVNKDSTRIDSAKSLHEMVEDQSFIKANFLAIGHFYMAPLVEYEYKFRSASPFPASGQDLEMYSQRIQSDATLIAAMYWSRLAALNGYQHQWEDDPVALRYKANTTCTTTNLTLHRSWILVFILLINPAIFLAFLFARIFHLFPAPVGEQFGLISLLSSIEKESLDLIKGAGLSGKLSSPIRLQFDVQQSGVGTSAVDGRISTSLRSRAPNAELKSRVVYG